MTPIPSVTLSFGPTLAAVSLTFVLVGAWYAGLGIERFLESGHCWPLARRAAYACMALAIGQGIFDVVRRLI